MVSLFSLFVFGLLCGAAVANECMGIYGSLSCSANVEDHAFVRVKLVDDNLFRHSLMDQTVTSRNGFFSLHGCSKDFLSSIDPQIRIYHNCNITSEDGSVRWSHYIDQDHIGDMISIGQIELSDVAANADQSEFNSIDSWEIKDVEKKPSVLDCIRGEKKEKRNARDIH